MSVRDIILAASGVSGVPPATTDPQFPYITMLLTGDGTNGAQNNTFLDSSSNNFTITRNGNTTQGSVTPFGNNWSNYFNGSSIQATGSENINLIGNADFTIEAWVYSASTTFNQTIITTSSLASGARGFGWNLRLESNYNIKFYVGSGTAGTDLEFLSVSSTGITRNTWNHIAIVRNGATVYCYVNGVLKGSAAMPATYNLTGTIPCQIGQRGTFIPENFVGYISNARVVNGTAVYTSGFTPSTSPLTAISGTTLLACESNRFKDNSSNNFTITLLGSPTVQSFSPFSPTSSYSSSTDGASAYFDGTGDYLSAPSNSAFAFGTGDFTVEYFVYETSWSNAPTIIDLRSSNPSSNGYADYYSTAGKFNLYWGTNTLYTSVATIKLNEWNHIAVSRSGTTVRVFINGVLDGTFTSSFNFTDSNCRVGANTNATPVGMTGNLSNVRIVKGTAVYTSAFTPLTSPLTNITNTSLLFNFTNAGIIDNAKLNNLETIGNAQISTAQSKFGGSSMYFDGTGDWLTYRNTFTTQLQIGNFTIECWLYLSTTGTDKYICAKGTSTTGWAFGVNASNQLIFNYASTNLTATTALSSGIWYHVAVVRNGTATGNLKIYLNGTLDATSGVAVNTNFNQTNIGYIGADRTATNPMNGYIDDLRITNGYARYTANFTPPTAAFFTS